MTSGAATFGVQRLAIRGLDDGSQPLFDRTSGLLAVCNGEIDNHLELRRWLAARGRHVEGSTDVAILPALYDELGEAFVEKLVGVFAIALWSPQANRLILARDRAGERPLFYRKCNGLVYFATELAALTTVPPVELAVDHRAISGYLRSGCFVAPESPFMDISKVRPGELIALSGANVSVRRFWSWPITTKRKTKPSAATFDGIFRAAIERQTTVEAPYGFFLSGGLDSSLIVAVAKSLRPEVRPPCYTLQFSETSYDESRFAERVADRLGLDLITVPVRPENFIQELPILVRRVGEPLADPAWIPTTLLSRRAELDTRIVFTGEGGDELFGGYPTYIGERLARNYEKLPKSLRRLFNAFVRALPNSTRKVTLTYLAKRFIEGQGLDAYLRHQLWTSNIAPDMLARLGSIVSPMRSHSPTSEAHALDQIQLHDFETTLAEGLLTKSDRGGMSASIEIRAPFLDHDVMEFAATLPHDERVNGTTTKYFLKHYAEKYLPTNIVHRRKRGLSVPLSSWLRGPLHQWASDRLRAGRLAAAGLNTDEAKLLLREHQTGLGDHSRPLWALLVLDEWLTWVEEQSAATLSPKPVSPTSGFLLPSSPPASIELQPDRSPLPSGSCAVPEIPC